MQSTPSLGWAQAALAYARQMCHHGSANQVPLTARGTPDALSPAVVRRVGHVQDQNPASRDNALESTIPARRVSYTGPTAQPRERPAFVSEQEWRAHWAQAPVMPDGVATRAQWARAYAAGNCGDLAAVAFDYLRKVGVFPVDFLELLGGDHAFVAIGRRDGDPLQDYFTWTNAFICDPWADIACPAPQFPAEWARQMTAWSTTRRYLSRMKVINPATMTGDVTHHARGLLKRARNSVIDIYIWQNHARIEVTLRRPWDVRLGDNLLHETAVIEPARPGRVQPVTDPAPAHGERIVPEYLDPPLRQRCVRYEFAPGNAVLSEGQLKRWWDRGKAGPDEGLYKKASTGALSKSAFSLCARAVQEASYATVNHRDVKYNVILRNWDAGDLIKFIEHAYAKSQ